MIARTVVDGLVALGIIPSSHFLFKKHVLPIEWWHPAMICIIMGILRAIAPYGASFQGSRVGRILTRAFFKSAYHRWLPIQRIRDLNLDCDDCQERDEVSVNADLAKLAKKVAKALGNAQSLGLDGMEGQNESLAEEDSALWAAARVGTPFMSATELCAHQEQAATFRPSCSM
jgi:hypothetical protein